MIRELEIVTAPDGIGRAALAGRAVVVVDVLRACSTIVTALANGARAVIPVEDPAEAQVRARVLGRAGVVLGGERGSLPVPGFDAGNSPSSYGPKLVAGKTLIFTTTNGTRALRAASAAMKNGSRPLLCGAFVNLSAVAAALDDSGAERGAVVCSGQDGAFSLEDFACAGAIATKLAAFAQAGLDHGDAVEAAARLYQAWSNRLLALMEGGRHARSLIALGLRADIADCARVDVYGIAPRLRDGALKA